MLVYIAVRFLLASDSDVASAFLGLAAVAFAWLAYIGLREFSVGTIYRGPISAIRFASWNSRGDRAITTSNA